MRWWPVASLFAAGAAAVLAPATDDERRARRGSVRDRGRTRLVGLDKLRAEDHQLAPVVQFLTFLQDRRGDPNHLLFVRMEDIDDLAEASGEPSRQFLARLDQLGVVVSAN